MEHHPDRHAKFGATAQQAANRQMKQINAAYRQLRRKRA